MIFQKLGLAITFSPNALSLLRYAKRLQDLFGSQLCLIHAGEKVKETEDLMKQLLAKAGIDDKSCELVWQKGDPAKVIINACASSNVDLLIAGALEKESMLKYYIGSVARRIMREASCSVLILTHPAAEPKPFKRFCVSVHFNRLGEYAILKAHEFAKLEHAEELTLVREFQIPGLAITISEGISAQEVEKRRIMLQKEEEQKLNVFSKELNLTDIKLNSVCLCGKEGWESGTYAHDHKCELLVIPSPQKKLKFFDRIFQHDIEFILKQLPCDLLIIREKE